MPPLSSPRAVQVSRTLKHLVPLGWTSWVVCFGPRSQRYHQDHALAARLRAPQGVTLVPVPSREERLFFRALWRICPPVQQLPDAQWVWIADAAHAAQRLAAERQFSALVSYGQPWSDHLIGLRVHRATGLPWIAHFSDPWTDSPYLRGWAWQWRIWRRMEAEVVREADALVFVSPQAADHVMQKYPAAWRGKSHVVPHGFECGPGDGDAAPRPSPADGRLRLVHTGRFYAGMRTPDSLLRALAALARRRPLDRELHVTFVGPVDHQPRQLACRLGLDGLVEFTGRVAFADSARLAHGADVLVVIDAPSATESLFLPSKLVDYLPMGKPILGITPLRGPSADLIRALGYPVAAPDDEPSIEAAIESLIEANGHRRLSVSGVHGDVSQRYDIRRTTQAFAEILERCT